MSEIRTELKYLSSHEWARVEEDGTVTVGISDYAQSSLGDVVFVETPEVGAQLAMGEEAGVVERSEEHTSELQSRGHLVCRLLLEKKKKKAKKQVNLQHNKKRHIA